MEPGSGGQAARILAAVQAKLTSQNAETSFTQTQNTNDSSNNKKTNFPFYV